MPRKQLLIERDLLQHLKYIRAKWSMDKRGDWYSFSEIAAQAIEAWLTKYHYNNDTVEDIPDEWTKPLPNVFEWLRQPTPNDKDQDVENPDYF